MHKLEHFVRSRTDGVLGLNNQYALRPFFDEAAKYYKAPKAAGTQANRTARREAQSVS